MPKDDRAIETVSLLRSSLAKMTSVFSLEQLYRLSFSTYQTYIIQKCVAKGILNRRLNALRAQSYIRERKLNEVVNFLAGMLIHTTQSSLSVNSAVIKTCRIT